MNPFISTALKRITIVTCIIMGISPTYLKAESVTMIELQKQLSEKTAIISNSVAEVKAQELQVEKAISLGRNFELKKEGPDKQQAREEYLGQRIKMLGDRAATNKKLRTVIGEALSLTFQIEEEQSKGLGGSMSQHYSNKEKLFIKDNLGGLMVLLTDTVKNKDGEFGGQSMNYLILEGLVAQAEQEKTLNNDNQSSGVFYDLTSIQSVLNLQYKALKRKYDFFQRASVIGVGQSVSRQIKNLVASFGGAAGLFGTGKLDQTDIAILATNSSRGSTHIQTNKPDLNGLAARINNL